MELMKINSNILEYVNLNYSQIIDSLDISESSKTTYLPEGREFLKFINENGLHIDSFINFKSHLLTLDKSDQWKSIKLTVAKAILQNLSSHRRLIPDITANIKGIKVNPEHKDGLNFNEIKQVRAFIDSIEDINKRTRLKAMFTLLALQGFRQFEITNLKIEDIDYYNERIKINGKGGITQHPKLHIETIAALRAHISQNNIKEGYLFIPEKKGETKLTERGFRKIWAVIFQKLHIERSVHGFRHFFTTHLLEATDGNAGIVRQFTRHKSVITVNRYDDRRLQSKHNDTFQSAFTF